MTDWFLEEQDHGMTGTVVDAPCPASGGACGDNPWLSIPAADYEGHMGSPSVAQLELLARVFREALAEHDCRSVAVLGCATGNGFDAVRAGRTSRLTAVDLNPEYLEIARRRYADRIPELEILQADLAHCELQAGQYTLISAGLIFEYLEPGSLLRRAARWLTDGGVLAAVVQLPSEHSAPVTATRYTSLEALSPIMRLVEPSRFRQLAADVGLTEIDSRTETLRSGKSFWVAAFQKKVLDVHERP